MTKDDIVNFKKSKNAPSQKENYFNEYHTEMSFFPLAGHLVILFNCCNFL